MSANAAPPLPSFLLASLQSPTYLRRAVAELTARDRARFSSPATTNAFSWRQALAHRSANRYADIIPWDHSLATPRSHAGMGRGQGYLNANWVRVPEVLEGERDGQAERRWVAAQAPLPQSFDAFYTLLYEEEIPSIVQLTRWTERDRIKADPYLPTPTAPLRLPSLTVTHQSSTTSPLGIVSTVLLLTPTTPSASHASKTVTHHFYPLWPDHSLPPSPLPLLHLLSLLPPSSAPVLVHCSAGIGRTGTFIVLAHLARVLPLMARGAVVCPTMPDARGLTRLPQEWKEDLIVRAVDGLRERRGLMVEGNGQVEWLYDAGRVIWEEVGRGGKALGAAGLKGAGTNTGPKAREEQWDFA